MTGFSARVVPVIVLLLAGRAAAQAQRLPAFDPERIFILGDADLDGRLSLDEYRDFLRSSPRMKDAAATIEPMFRRLDADRDGFLSLSEYRKSFPPRPGGAAAKPEAPKETPPDAEARRLAACPDHARAGGDSSRRRSGPCWRRSAASATRAPPRSCAAGSCSTAGRASAAGATPARRSCPATRTRAC